MTAAAIAEALGGRRSGPNRWVARCPAHDDRGPSLSLTERDGKVLAHCFAGCDQVRVIEALRARGLWQPNSPRLPQRIRWQAWSDAARLEDWRRGIELELRERLEDAHAAGDLEAVGWVTPRLHTVKAAPAAVLRELYRADPERAWHAHRGWFDLRFSRAVASMCLRILTARRTA